MKKEILEEIRSRINILAYKRPEKPYNSLPYRYSDWVKEKYKWYDDQVLEIIDILGEFTLINGHSEKLDILKNDAYRLVGLSYK